MKTKQAKHLLLTDFELIKRAMSIGLTPLQYRILQYMICCWSHDQPAAMDEAAEWVGIDYLEISNEFRVIASNPRYRELENFVYQNGEKYD